MKKRIIVSLLAAMALLPSVAQVSTTLSPFSQYGLGVLSDQSAGFNRGMGGVAYGLRNGKFVNMQNPASYSAIDSLSMIFDAGVTGQISNYKEGGKSLNTKTGNFDYAVLILAIPTSTVASLTLPLMERRPPPYRLMMARVASHSSLWVLVGS